MELIFKFIYRTLHVEFKVSRFRRYIVRTQNEKSFIPEI